jgi:hypothetical protein
MTGDRPDLTPSQRRRRDRAPELSIRLLTALRDGDERAARFALQRLTLEEATAFMAAYGYANALASVAGGGMGSATTLVAEITVGDGPADHPLALAAAFIPAVSNGDDRGARALWTSVSVDARLELLVVLARLAAKAVALHERNHLYPGTGAP